MPRIVLENFDRGLARDFVLQGSETANTKRGDGKNLIVGSLGGVSPFPNPGYLCPAFGATNIDSTDAGDVTTQITSWAVKTTFAQNQTSEVAAYGIGDNILYKVIGTGYTDIVDNTPSTPTWPHTIPSVVLNPGDIGDVATAIQLIGVAQTACLFYSYNVASGNGYLGRFDITNDDDWGGGGSSSDTQYALTQNDVSSPDQSGILSVPRPIVAGTNKILYVAGGYKIDSLDLTTSSASIVLNALDIDQNYEIQSLGFWQGSLVIGAQLKQSQSGLQRGGVVVFFWDTFSSSFQDPIFIDDDTCGAIYADDKDLYVFTANQVYGNLRRWDGRGFDSIQQISKAIPKHNGVDKHRNGLVWGDSNGKAWWFGEAVEDSGEWLWNFATVGTSLSCVKKLDPTGDVLHFTGQDTGSTEFIRKSNTTFSASEVSMTILDLPHRSTIKRMEAHFLPLATGASVNISTATNLASGAAELYGNISYASDGEVTRKVFNSRITNVSQLGLNFTWTGGVSNTVKIERIIIDYIQPRTKLSS